MADEFNELDLSNFESENEDLFGDEFYEGAKDEPKKSKKSILLIVIAVVLAILAGYIAMKLASNKSDDSAVVSLSDNNTETTELMNKEQANDSQIPTSESNFEAEAEGLVNPNDNDGIPQKMVPDIKPVSFNPNKPSKEIDFKPVSDSNLSQDVRPAVMPEPVKTDEPEPIKIKPLEKKINHANKVSGWQVQIISLSDKSKVEAERARLVKKYPNLFADREFIITEARLSNGRTTNRLRVVGFSGRIAADSFCKSAKSQGIDCYIVPR